MNSGDYKELIVWQKAMDLVVKVYRLTESFPSEEKFGLVSQMRRCAVSIPSNIAEGRRRDSDNEFHRFLLIAFGSGAELETQIEIAKRLNFGEKAILDLAGDSLQEVMRILNKMSGV